MELLRSLVDEVNTILTKDDDEMMEPKMSPRDLRKVSPRLYVEFLHSDEMDAMQFLQDTDNLSDVMELLALAEEKEDDHAE